MIRRRISSTSLRICSREGWFVFYTHRYALHGRFDALHLALWYYLLTIEDEE
jgi:hypothetical protein